MLAGLKFETRYKSSVAALDASTLAKSLGDKTRRCGLVRGIFLLSIHHHYQLSHLKRKTAKDSPRCPPRRRSNAPPTENISLSPQVREGVHVRGLFHKLLGSCAFISQLLLVPNHVLHPCATEHSPRPNHQAGYIFPASPCHP